MDKFLSCDWGTTSFRLRLIKADNLKVIGEIKSEQGIAATFGLWQQQAGPSVEREAFYFGIVDKNMALLSEKAGVDLIGVPVILSGMASSTIGMADMPYKQIPINLDGSDLEIKVLSNGNNPYAIISGACTGDDVMRGEETKILGCAPLLPKSDTEHLLILPGTHPKHIFIKGDTVISFKTYMTGEFFDLLTTHSILAASVSGGGDFEQPENRGNFLEGVRSGRTANLLHQSFMARTNQVLKKMPPQQNYHYLSGLLIGAELKEINPGTTVCLIGSTTHMALYALACNDIGINVIKEIDADEALIRGQRLVFDRYFNRAGK
jgi:2-dehydro-3-deoxygalactonokinase